MASSKIDDPRVIEFDVRTDEMLINMGPQHPSTHGVLRLVLRTDGEVVSDVEPHIGYLHRCAEKIGENLTARQWVPYTDRMDYLAAMNMNLGWSLVIEKMLEYDLPERGRHLRVIISEMGRIASHLVAMGTYGLDLGSFTPFLYGFREREKILNLFEEACGARLTYSYLTPGGATADLPADWTGKCRQFLAEFKEVIPELHTLLTTNSIFVSRTAVIGVMSAKMAIDYGCTGPVLRGSGVYHDLRFHGEERYTEMYDGYVFDVICADPATGKYPESNYEFHGDSLDYPEIPRQAVLGDCWHRFYVRMLEVVQSVRLVEQAIEKYEATSGDWGTPIKLVQKLPVKEAYMETEAPRGQMGFYVVGNGESIPWRVRARSSSFCNLSVTAPLCQGILLADIPAIVGSLDVVMGEIDR